MIILWISDIPPPSGLQFCIPHHSFCKKLLVDMQSKYYAI